MKTGYQKLGGWKEFLRSLYPTEHRWKYHVDISLNDHLKIKHAFTAHQNLI